jgi:hypothetical protein
MGQNDFKIAFPMDLANIKLQGNASIVGNYIRLTKNKLFLSGQAFTASLFLEILRLNLPLE